MVMMMEIMVTVVILVKDDYSGVGNDNHSKR